MNILTYILDPAILLIVGTFIVVVVYCIKKFDYVNANLIWLIGFLKKYNKNDLSYRFSEFDKTISSQKYISNSWAEFKSTFVFSESVAIKNRNNGVAFQNVSNQVGNAIQTTSDPTYFFNEDSLVQSKYNSKFVQIVPTLLTGMGPLFTFLNIAIAFTKVDFSTQETTIASVSGLMSSMQIAALCSVLAVSSSLIFMFFEKIYYNKKCKVPLVEIQELMYNLFDSITSEKFLVELLKETKIQNNNLTNLLSERPKQLNDAIGKNLTKLVPYLENTIYGLNNLRETVKSIEIPKNLMQSGDDIDDLFNGGK